MMQKEPEMNKMICVETHVNATIDKVWKYWNEAVHIQNWYFASPDWYVPAAKNDLRPDGSLSITLASRDGSEQFDFEADYSLVEINSRIHYTMRDGRRAIVKFRPYGTNVQVTEWFEPESINAEEVQHGGWQSILNNFKDYVENH